MSDPDPGNLDLPQPSALRMRSLALLRLVALACAFTLSIPAQGPAPDPELLLQEVKLQHEALGNRHDFVGVRLADRVLERLEGLIDARAQVREDACLFLQRVLSDPDSNELLFRVRVTALRLVGCLGEHPARVEFLLKIAARGESVEYEGLEGWVEDALTRIRTAEQARCLLDHVEAKDKAVQRVALGALARLENGKLLHEAVARSQRIMHLAASPDVEVRSRAVRLLGRVPDDLVLVPLLRASKDPDPLVRLAAAWSLGHKIDRPGVTTVLSHLVEDATARVREEAVVAFGKAQDPGAAPVLVARMEKEPLRLRAAIAESLKGLTGADLGTEPPPWRLWLDSARATGRLRDDAKAPFRTPPPRYAPQYYGLPILSDRLVFVLDISGSMNFSTAAPAGATGGRAVTRLQVAKDELCKALQALDPRTEFNIVVFSASPVSWLRQGLAKAGKERIQEAVEYVRGLHPSGGTNSHGVLELVFKDFPSIDTIYFLSDGSPTVGKTAVHERILADVRRWNRLRGVRIHAIALLSGDAPNPALAEQDDKDDAARFMSALARETGGAFLRRE